MEDSEKKNIQDRAGLYILVHFSLKRWTGKRYGNWDVEVEHQNIKFRLKACAGMVTKVSNILSGLIKSHRWKQQQLGDSKIEDIEDNQ